MYIVRHYLYLTRATAFEPGRVVGQAHPEAAFLFATPGMVIADEEAVKHDLASIEDRIDRAAVDEEVASTLSQDPTFNQAVNTAITNSADAMQKLTDAHVDVAEAIEQNPEAANRFVEVVLANDAVTHTTIVDGGDAAPAEPTAPPEPVPAADSTPASEPEGTPDGEKGVTAPPKHKALQPTKTK